MYLNVLGKPMIVINSYDAAVELLENKSANNSDRPPMVMAQLYAQTFRAPLFTHSCCSTGLLDYFFVLAGYGAYWRGRRRTFHEFFQHGAISKYQPVFRRNTHRFLRNLLEKPEKFWEYSHL